MQLMPLYTAPPCFTDDVSLDHECSKPPPYYILPVVLVQDDVNLLNLRFAKMLVGYSVYRIFPEDVAKRLFRNGQESPLQIQKQKTMNCRKEL